MISSIAEELRSHGISLRSYTVGTRRALCPKCSATRSPVGQKDKCCAVTIDDDGATWLCHHCDFRGGFRLKVNGRDDRPLPKANGEDKSDTPRHFPQPDLEGPSGREVLAYLNDRTITEATARRAGIGADVRTFTGALRSCVAFAYRTAPGAPILGIKYRTTDLLAAKSDRIRAADGSHFTCLWGVDQIDHTISAAVLTEGEIDALSFTEAGIANAVSIPHGANKTVDGDLPWLDPLRGLARVVLVLDNDPTGIAMRKAVIGRLGYERCAIVEFADDIKDANEFLMARGKEALAQLYAAARPATSEDAPPLPCLTVADWLARELPAPDFLLGDLLSTTSRMMLVAPTGLGKTMLTLALAFAVADGHAFLHWSGRRQARVLFIDGEMSRQLMKQRISDAERRHGGRPATLFILSREDVPDMEPLNMAAGQAFIDRFIEKIGGVDLVIFDNIQALTVGDMKEEESWAQTLPWVKALTKRRIGQLWVHHTGHDETHGYGTKTKEWQLDAVAILKRSDNEDADLAFLIEFTKARQRTPDNRADFAEATITLSADQWRSTSSPAAEPAKPVSPKADTFRRALADAIAASGNYRPESAGRPSVTVEQWEQECGRLGLVDMNGPDNRRRALLSKYRLELIGAQRIACNGNFAWTL